MIHLTIYFEKEYLSTPGLASSKDEDPCWELNMLVVKKKKYCGYSLVYSNPDKSKSKLYRLL